jgi:reverse gyrase
MSKRDIFYAGKCPKCGGELKYSKLYTTSCSECDYEIVVDFGFNSKRFFGGSF